MKKCLLVIPVLILSLISAFGEARQVEGRGEASGTGEGAKQEAVNRALRNALEKSIGVRVSSESLVKNFQLLQDSIYSNVQGYVKDYQILEDNKGEGGITQVKVLATVEENKLETDLRGIKVILDAKGNPRTVIVMTETIDGEHSPFIRDKIEKFFSDKSFPMIDKAQLETIKMRDAEDAEKDPSKAKALGNRFGADLILSGIAQTKMSDQREAYGVPVYTYTGSLSLKAVSADTGEILASLNEDGMAHAGNQREASVKALSGAWEKGQEAFWGTLMEKWRSSVLNTSEMILIVSKCSPAKRPEILNKLMSVEGIQKLNEKSYKNEVSEFTCTVDGVMVSSLEQKITEACGELILTAKTPNRLDFEVKAE